MKKVFILVLCSILFTGYVNAQKFYARVGIGMSGGTSNSLDILYKYTNDGTNRTLKLQPVDLGSGFTGSAAFGFMPSKYVGFEIAITDFIGFPDFGDSIVKMPGGTSTNAIIKANVLSVVPSVVITAGLDKVNPYARFGVVIGVLPVMRNFFEADQPSVNPPKTIKAIQEYTGGVALGFSAAGGVNFKINKLISLYAEINYIGMSFAPTKSELVKYTIDGIDQLPTINTKERETQYVTKLNLDEQIPNTSPDKKLKKNYPLNSVGASFGVMFKF